MMSDTVNIPANLGLALFHRGVDTTPAMGLMDRKEEQGIDTDH